MRFTPARLLAALLSLPLLAACQQEQAAALELRHNPEGKGTPVARFNGDTVTLEQIEERAAQLSPFQRTRLQTQEGRKEMVEGFARFELVVQEAVERGLHNDPAVIAEAKRVMVDRLLQKELQEIAAPIPDALIAERYEKHKGDFVKPEMVRLVHVFLEAPREDAAKSAEVKAKIDGLLASARQLAPMDFKAFGALAREHSQEQRTKPLDGDMRYLSKDELSEQYGAEVADAATQLSAVGDLSGVVQTAKGFHILKLQGRQAALDLKLEHVRTQLIKEIASERRGSAYAQLIERLEKKAGLTVDDAALAKLKVDMARPAVRTDAPTPGFLPPPGRAAGLVNDIPVPPPGLAPAIPPASAKESK